MNTTKQVKTWFQIHKWTSLICTGFLLMLCLTGLPLIFHEEIEAWEGKPHQAGTLPVITKKVPLDQQAETVLKASPNKVIRFVYWQENKPNVTTFSLSDSVTAPADNVKTVIVNDYTGKVVEEPNEQEGFMYVMFKMHTELFMGIGGKLFLGLMGLLFLLAILSGMMLYSPIMKRFNFGMVRSEKSTRLKWLDLHNLLGVVTIAWASIVGFTGVINTMAEVVLGLWQIGQLAEMTAPYKNATPLIGQLSSPDQALALAQQAAPDMEPTVIAYPGTMFTSKHHYAVFMRGNTPLTKRLLKPALIDAKTGKLTDMRSMPWYVNALFVSEPLHFGDYGGLPLKIIWAIFDLITIIVLMSGLYLWFARNKATKAQLERQEKTKAETTSQQIEDAEILTLNLQEDDTHD